MVEPPSLLGLGAKAWLAVGVSAFVVLAGTAGAAWWMTLPGPGTPRSVETAETGPAAIVTTPWTRLPCAPANATLQAGPILPLVTPVDGEEWELAARLANATGGALADRPDTRGTFEMTTGNLTLHRLQGIAQAGAAFAFTFSGPVNQATPGHATLPEWIEGLLGTAGTGLVAAGDATVPAGSAAAPEGTPGAGTPTSSLAGTDASAGPLTGLVIASAPAPGGFRSDVPETGQWTFTQSVDGHALGNGAGRVILGRTFDAWTLSVSPLADLRNATSALLAQPLAAAAREAARCTAQDSLAQPWTAPVHEWPAELSIRQGRVAWTFASTWQPPATWLPGLACAACRPDVEVALDAVTGDLLAGVAQRPKADPARVAQPAWQLEADLDWRVQPVVANGTWFATGVHGLQAVWPNGTLRWSVDLPEASEPWMSPAVSPAGVVALGYKGQLNAYHVANGTLAWRLETPGTRPYSVFTVGNAFAVSLSSGRVMMLEAATGHELWRQFIDADEVACTICPVEMPAYDLDATEDLLVASTGDLLVAFNRTTGERAWTLQDEGLGHFGQAAVAGDLLVTTGTNISALRQDGTTAWTFGSNASRELWSSATVAGDLVFASHNGTLHALWAKDGKELWRADALFAREAGHVTEVDHAPLVHDGLVWMSYREHLRAFRALDGALVLDVATADSMHSATVLDGLVVVHAAGLVQAFTYDVVR